PPRTRPLSKGTAPTARMPTVPDSGSPPRCSEPEKPLPQQNSQQPSTLPRSTFPWVEQAGLRGSTHCNYGFGPGKPATGNARSTTVQAGQGICVLRPPQRKIKAESSDKAL